MGLDIPDVERIIQWKLSDNLTTNCWWQRAGRAGRDLNIWAIAILFYAADSSRSRKDAKAICCGISIPGVAYGRL